MDDISVMLKEHRDAYCEAMKRIYLPFINEDIFCAICSVKIDGDDYNAFVASSIAVTAENFCGCLCPPCYKEFMIIPAGAFEGHPRTFLPYEEFLRARELKNNEPEIKEPAEE